MYEIPTSCVYYGVINNMRLLLYAVIRFYWKITFIKGAETVRIIVIINNAA